MAKRAKSSALDSFSPRLGDVWHTAAKEPHYEIPVGLGEDGKKAATRLRYRLYQYRVATQSGDLALYRTIKGISIRMLPTSVVKQGSPLWVLRFESPDISLEEILDNIPTIARRSSSDEPPDLE